MLPEKRLKSAQNPAFPKINSSDFLENPKLNLIFDEVGLEFQVDVNEMGKDVTISNG